MAITQKVTQHCKLSARRSCWYPRRAQNQVQISSLRSFQKLRWRELCTAYQISFWAKQYVTALHSFGVTIVVWLSRSVGSRISWFFPARRVRTILPLFKWLNHLNWSQFNRISFWESEFMKSLVEPIKRWYELPVTDILKKALSETTPFSLYNFFEGWKYQCYHTHEWNNVWGLYCLEVKLRSLVDYSFSKHSPTTFRTKMLLRILPRQQPWHQQCRSAGGTLGPLLTSLVRR